MRNRFLAAWVVGVLMLGLAGCAAEPSSTLPTATPAPTDVIPTTTATFLPPPTVTPFPTATPRGEQVIVVAPAEVTGGAQAAPEVSASPPTAALTEPSPTQAAPALTLSPAPPTAAPTSALVSLPDGVSLGDKVFTADFFQGWPSENFPTVKMGIVNGQYVLEVGPQDAGIRTTGVVKQKNLFEQIEVTPAACPDKGGYGIRFRLKDNSNYYRFSVFCGNTYSSAAVINGSVTELSSGKLPEGLDAASAAVHKIGVAAFNQTFTLYFDGQVVVSAGDSQLDEGDVGLYAFSQGAQATTVAFDNWQVWSLR